MSDQDVTDASQRSRSSSKHSVWVLVGDHIAVNLDTREILRGTEPWIAPSAASIKRDIFFLLVESRARHKSHVTWADFQSTLWPSEQETDIQNIRNRLSSHLSLLRTELDVEIDPIPKVGYTLRTPVVDLPRPAESTPSAPPPNATDREADQVGVPVEEPRRPVAWYKSRALRFGLTLAGTAICLKMLWLHLNLPQPANCRVDGSTLVVLDRDNNDIWTFPLPEETSTKRYGRGDFLTHPCVCKDIDGSGSVTVLFDHAPLRPSSPSKAQGTLYAVKKVRRWSSFDYISFQPAKEVTVHGTLPENIYEYPFVINTFIVVPNRSTGTSRIVVSSRHNGGGAANQVAVLDHKLNQLREYWYPGHLTHAALADLDHDGTTEVVLGGVNNGHHSAVLVTVNPSSLSGTPQDLPDARFTLKSVTRSGQVQALSPGTETCTVLIDRSDVSLFTHQPFNRVIGLIADENRLLVHVAESHLFSAVEQVDYVFDYQWNIVSIVPQVSFVQRHQTLEDEGTIKHSFQLNELRSALKKSGCNY